MMVLETHAEQAAFRELVEDAWGALADRHRITARAPSTVAWPVSVVIFPDVETLAAVRFA